MNKVERMHWVDWLKILLFILLSWDIYLML